MFIELESIFNNIGSSRDVNYSFTIEDEELIDSDVKVSGSVVNRAGIVTFFGKASFVLCAVCDRCAEPFRREMTFDFDHILVNRIENEDNEDFILLEDMRLEVDSLIREDIILSLPTRFLCREDCKGLCHICGTNLNYKQCGCKAPVDARLAVLMQLLDDDNE